MRILQRQLDSSFSRHSRKGSALILVVVLTVLLAALGIMFMMVARLGEMTTSAMDETMVLNMGVDVIGFQTDELGGDVRDDALELSAVDQIHCSLDDADLKFILGLLQRLPAVRKLMIQAEPIESCGRHVPDQRGHAVGFANVRIRAIAHNKNGKAYRAVVIWTRV